MDSLHITRRASRLHAGLLLGVHLVTLLALVIAGLQPMLKLFLCLAVVLMLWHSLREVLLLSPGEITSLWAQNGQWVIQRVDGERRMVTPVGHVVVWPWLVAARLRDDTRCYELLLLKDSLDARSHRHCRVYFSLYAVPLPDDDAQLSRRWWNLFSRQT